MVMVSTALLHSQLACRPHLGGTNVSWIRRVETLMVPLRGEAACEKEWACPHHLRVPPNSAPDEHGAPQYHVTDLPPHPELVATAQKPQRTLSPSNGLLTLVALWHATH